MRREQTCIYDTKSGAEVARVDCQTITTDEEAEARALAVPMARAHKAVREFYQSEYTGRPQVELDEKVADRLEYLRGRAQSAPPADVKWEDIGALADVDAQGAVEVWNRVRVAAVDELESGQHVASTIGKASPLETARFFAMRDYFTDAWNPQNGIEQAMVDMLAHSYSLFLYWSQVSHTRAIDKVRDIDANLYSNIDRGWKLPYQDEADAVEQAAQMADRHNRLFLRTLRQMRDLRRYNVPIPPVIVNNGG